MPISVTYWFTAPKIFNADPVWFELRTGSAAPIEWWEAAMEAERLNNLHLQDSF
jgi:hypothetical protein